MGEALQSNLGSFGVRAKLTGDPVLEVIPVVRGGVGWRRDGHCERVSGGALRTRAWGHGLEALTLGEVGSCGWDGDPDR